MARATRSSATLAADPPRARLPAKKRKRAATQDPADDLPPQKHARVKDDDADEPRIAPPLPALPAAADVPITAADAQHILAILERIDALALLDRVFPLPADLSEPSSSTSQPRSLSLRALLRDPAQHPLRVLRAAVQNLFPVAYYPRSRASSPAAQQLRFCTLACALLDQASCRSVPVPLDLDSLLLDVPEPKSSAPKHALLNQTKKFALMQRLPFGTWWTSLNSDLAPSDGKPLKDLPTANAELVAVLPSPSVPAPPEPDTAAVTLASYVPRKPPNYKPKLPGPRRISCGTFLDYGPYTSFAPVFEQDGVELGRFTIGELFSRWQDRKQTWTDESALTTLDSSDQPPESPQPNGIDEPVQSTVLDDQETLEGLFSKEQVTLLKQALGSLELEAAVGELLERNANALKRLEELQNKRLFKGEFTPVEQGSEEWDTAQGILDSLALLTSLRPRLSSSDDAPLVPSPSALHRLQQTLPIAPTQGWHGTLPVERSTALRDDSTLYIKSTATAIPSAPSAPPATPTPAQPAATQPATTAAATAQAYAGYSYSYATPYRPGYQYKPGQPPYYPNAYATPATAQAQATSQYYQGQPYGAAQQQYTYSSWYQYNPQAQASASAGGSRKGTPQPSTAAAAATPTTAAPAMPTSYAGFFSTTAQTSGQRAVANTVAAAAAPAGKPFQPGPAGTWAAPTGAAAGFPPTLPPHMRSVVAGQPAAGAYNPNGMYQPNYYGTYQATPSPAQT